jgi:hypothetical protein
MCHYCGDGSQFLISFYLFLLFIEIVFREMQSLFQLIVDSDGPSVRPSTKLVEKALKNNKLGRQQDIGGWITRFKSWILQFSVKMEHFLSIIAFFRMPCKRAGLSRNRSLRGCQAEGYDGSRVSIVRVYRILLLRAGVDMLLLQVVLRAIPAHSL